MVFMWTCWLHFQSSGQRDGIQITLEDVGQVLEFGDENLTQKKSDLELHRRLVALVPL